MNDERERLWCQACGTVTRDKICGCNQWFNKGHEMYREPQFVNYADTMQEIAHEQAQEIESLRAELATAEATYLQFCKKHDEKVASIRNETIELCAKIADGFSEPGRFKAPDAWKEDMTPSEVYETGMIDASTFIAKDIRSSLREGT